MDATVAEVDVVQDSLSLRGTTFASDIRGLQESPRGEVEFAPEKIVAMRNVIEEIFPHLKSGFREDGMDDETFYTYEPRKGIMAKIFGPEKRVPLDGSRQFRGITLGDLLIAAIAGEGKIITQTNKGSTSVDITPRFLDAVNYAYLSINTPEKRSDAFKRFFSLLQVCGYSRAQIDRVGEVILSPLVLRFDREKLSRKRIKGQIKKSFYRSGSFQYVAPYLEIDDLTEECVEYIREWSGIDIKQLVQLAQEF